MLSFLFPPICPLCAKELLDKGEHICKICSKKQIFIKEPTCYSCGKSMKNQEKEYCSDCRRPTCRPSTIYVCNVYSTSGTQ